MGERFLNFEWPYLSASDFLEFSFTGNRVHFEDKMFSKRHALNALVLAECAEHKGRFLPDVINGIFSICDEGAQYYRHAGLCLFLVLSVCDSVTGGAFQHLFSNEKIRNIASYIYRVHIADQYYINFADCSPVAGRCSVREYLCLQS